MIYLSFDIGAWTCALPAGQVERVLPMVEMRPVPHAPDYVRGIMNYRGQPVPVIDLSRMLGYESSAPRVGSRMLLAPYPVKPAEGTQHLLGLLILSSLEAIRLDQAQFVPPGIRAEGSDCLGDLILIKGRSIQLIDIDRILPEALKASLFEGQQARSTP